MRSTPHSYRVDMLVGMKSQKPQLPLLVHHYPHVQLYPDAEAALRNNMIAKAPRPPRVAIIRNYLLDGSWGQDMLDSFSQLVLAAEPDAHIQYFQALEGGDLPDASRFDLVILTGGTYDLTLPDTDPWVAKLLGWIRETVSHNPETKLLGICWGHQAISHALGGKIAYRKDGTLVSLGLRCRFLHACV